VLRQVGAEALRERAKIKSDFPKRGT